MHVARFGALALVMIILVAAVAYLGALLVQTSTDLDTKTVALAEEESTNVVLEQTNRALMTDQARLEVYLEEATDRFGQVSAENVDLQSELVVAADRHTVLEADLARLKARHDALASAHEALVQRHETLADDYGDLAARHDTLAQRYAEVLRLSERLPDLQKRIAALEAQLAESSGR